MQAWNISDAASAAMDKGHACSTTPVCWPAVMHEVAVSD